MSNAQRNETLQQNTNDKRDHIKQAALTLFVKHGLGVSTSRITKEAGVATGLLFHYFPTKNDLIMDLYADALSGFNQTASRRPDLLGAGTVQDFIATVRAQVEDTWDWCLNNWESYQFMRLVEGAAIAELVLPEANERSLKENQLAIELMRDMSQHIPLRRVPDGLLLAAVGNNVKQIAEYMHEHPEVRYDRDFRDAAWRLYRSTLFEMEF